MFEPTKLLAEKGFFLTEPLYSENTIEKWNKLLDSSHKSQEGIEKCYVDSAKLYELGILSDIFNERLKSLLSILMPTAVLYHCHYYEIIGGQTRSHIHWGKNLGWHRDEECRFDYTPNYANHISMFIYLTDVNEKSGPFEIRTKPPFSFLQPGEKTLKVVGEKGTLFFFNRFFLHRACPNYSPIHRRVIKFSFQPRHLKNNRIHLEEFSKLRNYTAGQDEFINYLADINHSAESLLEIINKSNIGLDYPKAYIPKFNSSMEIGLKYITRYNLSRLMNKLKANKNSSN
ncbi:MAG: hypothetical protein N5P05_001704 [Chroococcopsis gigantea SAG 12.99]|jgi:hypothetical protein|nr:hypothetical protein [Chlorogloea purpurea SAG 13.99]MDV3000098.1 hypothetical protein [Chroococcopsis gigantea SAG 12.99]